ncbi:MAG: signal peptidase I [Clostridia bacterium]|nr:signal peptidase I [Clostridia bacterium]
MEATKKSPSVKKILSIVGNTILWLFVAFAIVITVIVFATNNSKSDDASLSSIGGLAMVTISSDSMSKSPNAADYQAGGRLEGLKGFNKGALIFVNKLTDAEKNDLKVGDVITFDSMRDLNGDFISNDINTHRIVEIHEYNGERYYVTRGDHNPNADGVYSDEASGHAASGYIVTSAMILGKWNGKKIGGLGNFLDFLKTRAGFFVVIILPLIAFFLYELIRFIMVIVSLKGKRTEDEIRQRVMEELLRAQQGPTDAPVDTYVAEPEAPAEEPKPEEGSENKE